MCCDIQQCWGWTREPLTVTAGGSHLHPVCCTPPPPPLTPRQQQLSGYFRTMRTCSGGEIPSRPITQCPGSYRFCFVLHCCNLEVRFLLSTNRNDPVVLKHWGWERKRSPELYTGFKSAEIERERAAFHVCCFCTSISLYKE